MIVCHITEGAFDGTVSWITNPISQVSYHFVVAQDGRIVQAVDITNMAWANGTTTNGDNRDVRHSPLQVVRDRRVNANLYTVSIGFEGRLAQTNGALTPAQLEAGGWLIAHIRDEIGRSYNRTDDAFPFERSHIVGHHEITPRTRPSCPGPQFPFDEILRQLNESISEPLEPEAPNIPPEDASPFITGHEPSNWARESWAWAIGNGLTDGTNPRNPATREQLMAIIHRYHNNIANS